MDLDKNAVLVACCAFSMISRPPGKLIHDDWSSIMAITADDIGQLFQKVGTAGGFGGDVDHNLAYLVTLHILIAIWNDFGPNPYTGDWDDLAQRIQTGINEGLKNAGLE